MLLDPLAMPSAYEASAAGDTDDMTGGDRLAKLVENAFPALMVGDRRIEAAGGDHVLLIVDEHYAFRFPRAGVHDLGLEIAVLERLQRRSVLPTPFYHSVDPAGRFAGYDYLQGSPLTPLRFAALPRAGQDALLERAASFLAELHAIPPLDVAPWDRWPRTWTAAAFAHRGISERLPLIVRHLPTMSARLDAFYARYRTQRPAGLVVVHGDLVAEHLLLDERTGRLAGIIDFGDVALGDPAQDFLGFWAYGADAAARVVALYPPIAADPGLLARSRDHFIRYRLDQLFDRFDAGGDSDLAQAGAEVDALLRGADPCH